jgi:uncharacterized membrane protein YqaE (UPF0057 family)
MKRKLLFLVTLTVISLFTATNSRAGFVVKQPATKMIVTNGTTAEAATTTATSETTTTIATKSEAKTHHSFFHRILGRLASKAAAVPEIVYIILAIIGFGWLAMGINDGFSGWPWIISLILYLLFYIPGLIYTLIKMGDYY